MALLQCPRCAGAFTLTSLVEDQREVRRGLLICERDQSHSYEIEDGIIRMSAGFDHHAVQKELEYDNSTYHGDDRLTDDKFVAQFPDRLAELWPHIRYFGPDFKVLIDRLNIQPGSWVLDIGTGPCWSSRLLAQQNCNVIAQDINDANYYGLKTSDILFAAHDVYFDRILESMTHLPFKNESIDYITFNASFHHTPDMAKTLVECERVLKPGGIIAMANEELVSLRQKLFAPKSGTITGSHQSIPYSDLERAIKKNGLVPEFYLAGHVQETLKKKLPRTVGNWIVKTLETFPLLLKQLNSALILLRKPGQLKTTAPAEPSFEMKR